MMAMDPTLDEQSRAEKAALWCVRLSEGQMAAADRAEFSRWLAEDERHPAAFDAAVASWTEVQAAEASPEMLPLRVEALESLQRAHRTRAARVTRLSRTRWGLAASLLVAAVLSAVIGYLRPTPFTTSTGERRTAILDDGSVLSLDASSEVEVRFTADRRSVRLVRGRAKFQVARDPLRPFSVAVANRNVVATGTAFSVELVQKTIHVVLYEGRVVVTGPQKKGVAEGPSSTATALPERETLVAGTELVAAVTDGGARVRSVDPVRSASWESGQLEFVDEPLASAVERMNRYTRQPMSIGDARAGTLPITGVFRAGEVSAFIEGVTAAFAVRVEQRDGTLTFLSSGSSTAEGTAITR